MRAPDLGLQGPRRPAPRAPDPREGAQKGRERERKGAVEEDRSDDGSGAGAEQGQSTDQSAVEDAQSAGDGKGSGEGADRVSHHDNSDRRRTAKRVKRSPQSGVVKRVV